jgi:hypothetical protein
MVSGDGLQIYDGEFFNDERHGFGSFKHQYGSYAGKIGVVFYVS